MTPPFAELVAATNFSFLRGASHPSDLVARALELGHTGVGIADRNSVAGVVRAYAALEAGRKATPILGKLIRRMVLRLAGVSPGDVGFSGEFPTYRQD